MAESQAGLVDVELWNGYAKSSGGYAKYSRLHLLVSVNVVEYPLPPF